MSFSTSILHQRVSSSPRNKQYTWLSLRHVLTQAAGWIFARSGRDSDFAAELLTRSGGRLTDAIERRIADGWCGSRSFGL